jgi:AraC-like DNA-binding protein/mannose-6-phosphate isomerase-like protein (cupin superfamily)
MENYRIEIENDRFKLTDMEFMPFPVEPFAVGTASHIHEAIELLYITDGDFDITCDNVTVRATAGDAVLFRSNSIHRTVAREKEKNFYWVLKVSPRLIINFLPKDKYYDGLLRLSVNYGSDKFFWSSDELLGSDIRRGFEKLADEYNSPDENSELAMRVAAAQVVLGVLRGGIEKRGENSELAELMYKAVVYINEKYADEISAESVSEYLGLSYSYFSRSFKKIIGSSFRAYLNNVRINHAEQLIMNTSKSVSEISELCGFENISYFISVYRTLKGEPPLRSKRRRGK